LFPYEYTPQICAKKSSNPQQKKIIIIKKREVVKYIFTLFQKKRSVASIESKWVYKKNTIDVGRLDSKVIVGDRKRKRV
jgi:hypothetical protein